MAARPLCSIFKGTIVNEAFGRSIRAMNMWKVRTLNPLPGLGVRYADALIQQPRADVIHPAIHPLTLVTRTAGAAGAGQ